MQSNLGKFFSVFKKEDEDDTEYSQVAEAAEKLSYRNKLRLAQSLLQRARNEEAEANPQPRPDIHSQVHASLHDSDEDEVNGNVKQPAETTRQASQKKAPQNKESHQARNRGQNQHQNKHQNQNKGQQGNRAQGNRAGGNDINARVRKPIPNPPKRSANTKATGKPGPQEPKTIPKVKDPDEDIIAYVATRVLKLRPVKKSALENSIKSMFQMQGGIGAEDIGGIIDEMVANRYIFIEDNKVTYLVD